MRKRTFSIFLAGLVLLLLGPWASAAGLEADMVVLNGKILTADSPDPNNFTTAQAAAIYDGKFIVVGSNEEALEYAGAEYPENRRGRQNGYPRPGGNS